MQVGRNATRQNSSESPRAAPLSLWLKASLPRPQSDQAVNRLLPSSREIGNNSGIARSLHHLGMVAANDLVQLFEQRVRQLLVQ